MFHVCKQNSKYRTLKEIGRGAIPLSINLCKTNKDNKCSINQSEASSEVSLVDGERMYDLGYVLATILSGL